MNPLDNQDYVDLYLALVYRAKLQELVYQEQHTIITLLEKYGWKSNGRGLYLSAGRAETYISGAHALLADVGFPLPMPKEP